MSLFKTPKMPRDLDQMNDALNSALVQGFIASLLLFAWLGAGYIAWLLFNLR
jgi:hypothetical protein